MRKSLLLLGLIAAPALAIPIPGADFSARPLPGTTASMDPGLAGSVVWDRLVPFGVSGGAPGVHGTVQVRILKEASGTLDFYWSVRNDATSTGAIDQFIVRNYPKVDYDANWRMDGLGNVAPATVSGASGTGPAAWVIGFQFAQPIAPGQSSRMFFLRTRDHNWVPAPESTARLRGPGGFVSTINIPLPRP